MKIQDLRGAIRTLDSAPGLVKSREDMVSLNLVQGRQSPCGFGSDRVTLRIGRVMVLSGFGARHRNQIPV